MGCYLEDYLARVGTWAGRIAWRGGSKRGDDIGTTGKCLGFTMLSFLIVAVLLLIGGIEKNPGRSGEHGANLMFRMRKESEIRYTM
jgi:hypothetical protein